MSSRHVNTAPKPWLSCLLEGIANLETLCSVWIWNMGLWNFRHIVNTGSVVLCGFSVSVPRYSVSLRLLSRRVCMRVFVGLCVLFVCASRLCELCWEACLFVFVYRFSICEYHLRVSYVVPFKTAFEMYILLCKSLLKFRLYIFFFHIIFILIFILLLLSLLLLSCYHYYFDNDKVWPIASM